MLPLPKDGNYIFTCSEAGMYRFGALQLFSIVLTLHFENLQDVFDFALEFVSMQTGLETFFMIVFQCCSNTNLLFCHFLIVILLLIFYYQFLLCNNFNKILIFITE